MSHKSVSSTISTIGIDIGKNSFHLVGVIQARSGPPRGCPPPVCATVAEWRIRILLPATFPPRSARWIDEMDERSARRNQETGCQDGPSRSFS
jgi:hypothetical protein